MKSGENPGIRAPYRPSTNDAAGLVNYTEQCYLSTVESPNLDFWRPKHLHHIDRLPNVSLDWAVERRNMYRDITVGQLALVESQIAHTEI